MIKPGGEKKAQDKGAHAQGGHPDKPLAEKTAPAAAPAAKAHAAPAGDPTKFGGGLIPVDDAKRVGSFAAVARWVFELIGGVVIVALISARPAWLFGVVGVPVVLASYLFGTFAGGRVSRNYLKQYTGQR